MPSPIQEPSVARERQKLRMRLLEKSKPIQRQAWAQHKLLPKNHLNMDTHPNLMALSWIFPGLARVWGSWSARPNYFWPPKLKHIKICGQNLRIITKLTIFLSTQQFQLRSKKTHTNHIWGILLWENWEIAE